MARKRRGSGARRAPARSSDEAVQSLLLRGDRAGAATVALLRHGPAIRNVLSSLLPDDGDAAEAYSRFEEHLWTGLTTFRGDSSLRTWLIRLARNAATDVRREAWRRYRDSLDALPGADGRALEQVHEATELREILGHLRKHLSQGDEELLALRIDAELNWADIARAYSHGEPSDPTTVIKRFARIVQRLRRMARQRGMRR